MKKNKNTIYILIFIIIVLTTFLVSTVEKFTNPTPDSYDIVIIMGQSNSVGYGTRNSINPTRYGSVLPSEDDSPQNNIQMYLNFI